LSIVYAAGLLTGYYVDRWTLYVPYLVTGALFWVLVLASIINIFPSATVGHVRTGRLWFHHYIYGFLVSALALAYLIILAPISILSLFTANTTNITVNVGRFFMLGGFTLILDDLPDVSNELRRALRFLKLKVYRGRRLMHLAQYITGCLSTYLFTAVVLYITKNPRNATPGNLILSANLIITSLVSFSVAKRKVWLQIVG
jgi:prepilin signal peptidase PulO-like enzyme (type II secretory pathway)